MTRNIKLTIEYKGNNFKGWQIQGKGEKTVQGEIIKAAERIFKHKIKLIGSGRTDTGVHALGQVANFQTASDLSCETITKALNANLPKDISILSAENASPKFHAQYQAKQKTYRYTILNRQARSPLLKDTSYHHPYKLNLSLMRSESMALLGKNDFKSFQSSDPSKIKENTVRTIKIINIKKQGHLITIDIEADGFLYKMVRNIVGTLLEIGSGKKAEGSMKEILKKMDRNCAGATAKPQGLCLLKVDY